MPTGSAEEEARARMAWEVGARARMGSAEEEARAQVAQEVGGRARMSEAGGRSGSGSPTTRRRGLHEHAYGC